jgi:hypothetical protein
MSVWNKIGTSTWTKINSIFTKTSGSWTEIVGVWVKTSSNAWTRVFTRLLLAANTVPPAITGSTKLYGTLTGSIGTWTAPNGTNSYARQWQSAANVNDAPGSFGTTQTSGQTSSTYTTTDAVDGRWVRVRVVATNLSGDSTAFSDPVLITKFKPVALIIPAISGTPAVNITLTALTTVGTYWKNTTTNTGDTAPDSFTYRWYWGDTGDNIGSNSPTYTVVEADLGHTIRVDVTAKNTGGETTSTSNQTAAVGQPIGISDVDFEDENGDSGFNNRNNLVTATYLTLKFKVSGVNTSTTFRVRYRVLNNQTGAYWNPDSETATTASAAWITYESDYYNIGNISNVTISGGDAFISDTFRIPEIFNGSTFSGGISRWTWEYDISAVIGGNRYYWVPGDTVSRSFTYDWWDIDPTTNPTISPSSADRTTTASVTFTGTLASYPAGLSAYTRAYKMVYGDGTDSGWFYPTSGASNTTYSFTKTYSTVGTYYPYITAIPYYAIASSTITVSDGPVNSSLPTLSTDTNNYSAGSVITIGAGSWTGANSYKYELLYSSSTPVPTNSSTFTPNASNQYTITNSNASDPSYYFRAKVTAYSGLSQTGISEVAYSDTSSRSYIIPSTTISVSSASNSGFTISGKISPAAGSTVFAKVTEIYIYNSSQTLVATLNTGMPTASTTTATLGDWTYTWTGGASETTYYAKVKVESLDTAKTTFTSGFSSSITTTTSFVTPTPGVPAAFVFSRNLNGGTSTTRRNWFWNVSSGIGSYREVIYELYFWNQTNEPTTTGTTNSTSVLTFGSVGSSAPVSNAQTYNFSGTGTASYRTMARGSSYSGSNGVSIAASAPNVASWAKARCTVIGTNGTTYGANNNNWTAYR